MSKETVFLGKEHYMDSDLLLEMANVRGSKVRVPHKLNFSFFFSIKGNNSHGIRVKPVFNPDRLIQSETGNLNLHGDWKFTPGKNDKSVSSKEIEEMKDFFKKYKVLFAAEWEDKIQADEIQDYLRGMQSLSDLIKTFDFYSDYKEDLDKIKTVEELEKFIRDTKVFNMND